MGQPGLRCQCLRQQLTSWLCDKARLCVCAKLPAVPPPLLFPVKTGICSLFVGCYHGHWFLSMTWNGFKVFSLVGMPSLGLLHYFIEPCSLLETHIVGDILLVSCLPRFQNRAWEEGLPCLAYDFTSGLSLSLLFPLDIFSLFPLTISLDSVNFDYFRWKFLISWFRKWCSSVGFFLCGGRGVVDISFYWVAIYFPVLALLCMCSVYWLKYKGGSFFLFSVLHQ